MVDGIGIGPVKMKKDQTMKKSYRNAVIGAGVVAVMLGTAVYAKGPAGSGFDAMLPGFEELDVDGNGGISIAEVKAAQDARFQEMDSDGDGILTTQEMTDHAVGQMQERMGMRFAKMMEWQDSDGDGGLNRSEFETGRGQQMFSRADADNDGVVTLAEFEAAKEQGRGRMGGGHRGDRSGRGG